MSPRENTVCLVGVKDITLGRWTKSVCLVGLTAVPIVKKIRLPAALNAWNIPPLITGSTIDNILKFDIQPPFAVESPLCSLVISEHYPDPVLTACSTPQRMEKILSSRDSKAIKIENVRVILDELKSMQDRLLVSGEHDLTRLLDSFSRE